ncbi:MAG: M55 family metallopeptidase, partial [Clostridia bacterium]|nr:M55 family metallopeptidase [Clostridia bacterium]
AAKSALSLVGKAKPYRVTLPAEIRIEYNRADYCDDAAKWSGAERLDARTLRKITDKIEVYRDILI